MNSRIRILNDRQVRKPAKYVLYWAQMNRRAESNHALLHAVDLANEQKLPVLFYEGLTCTYPHANDRHHTFLMEGVPETARRVTRAGIGYVFYLRRRRSDPNDVLYRLAADAAIVVSDDYPAFIAREHNQSVPAKLDVPFHVVDSSCVVPMSMMEKREYAAYTIRPKIHRLLPECLVAAPKLRVSREYTGTASEYHLAVSDENIAELVASCEIDHTVKPSLSFKGGRLAAQKHLQRFVKDRLRRFARERNEPSAHATSDISPYLHYGHISSLEVALAVKQAAEANGYIADEYLEELIVRRELAFNFARFSERPDTFDGLPDWAKETMRKHEADKREPCYTREQFESAETHDALWNATQKEMLLRGKVHGYYRMYWGKKIIEWSATHQEALDTMVYLHDRYAVDGRDPNTYTNILWCFGLHDRPWKERSIFGMLRYMSFDGMKRKTNIDAYMKEVDYLERTGQDPFRVQ